MYLNKIIVFGRLVEDAKTRNGNNGAITNARIAFSPSRKPQQDVSQFINVTAFGKTAEILAKFGKKGEGFVFEGSLTQDTWKDKNTGEDRKAFGINVNSVIFPGRNNSEGNTRQSTPQDEPF